MSSETIDVRCKKRRHLPPTSSTVIKKPAVSPKKSESLRQVAVFSSRNVRKDFFANSATQEDGPRSPSSEEDDNSPEDEASEQKLLDDKMVRHNILNGGAKTVILISFIV